jgi:hypothetical protein
MSWKKEYKIFDHLGSVRMNIAENGSIIKEYEYEPFGGFFGAGNNSKGNNTTAHELYGHIFLYLWGPYDYKVHEGKTREHIKIVEENQKK